MKDQTVKDLEDLFAKARTARRRYEPTWYLNLAYAQGNQWVYWNGNALSRPVLRPNRITYVDNRILPAVRTEVAKLTKAQPVFTVSPETSDEDDAHAAELGERLMRYFWRHLNLTELTVKGLLWSRICGAGFFKAFWDPSLGDGTDCVAGPDGRLITDENGRPFRAAEVNPLVLGQQLGVPVGKKRVAQGDIRVETRSPFQMYVDPLADSFSEAEWLIEVSVKSVESIQQRYGVTLEADAAANPGLIEASLGAGAGSGGYKGVRVKEYWHRPNAAHPNGCRRVWAKNQLLVEDEQPFDSFPYVMLSGVPIPGRLWPTSIAEQLRPLQDELNKVKSQIAENRGRVGNPTILASKQSVQDPNKFSDNISVPGGIAWFDDVGSPNAAPTYLQAPPLPQYVIDEITRIEEAIQQVSGQHEVSSASVPPGVTAASAINLLLEADDTQLGPAVTNYETNLAALGQKVLKLAAHYYTDQRTIRIAGENGLWEIFPFRGAMLKNNTNVEVQAGSAFPQSKAAKQAAMQDLLTFFVQSGNPPHGRQLAQFLKDWEVGGAQRLIEDYTRDESQANRENVLMHQQIPVPVNDFDDDQAHIDAHQDEQKGQGYATWSPEAKQIIEAHVSAHKQRLAGQQQAQMQLQAQQQGAPSPQDQAAQQGQQAAQGAQDLQGGQLQQAIQAAQAQHQIGAASAQQGQQMAQTAESSAQQQRQAEELHQQKLRHAEELHQAALRQRSQQQQKGAAR